MIHLAQRASAVTESLTLAITARANAMRLAGADVISFGAGEPDLPPPVDVIAGAREALDEGFCRYTPTAGILPLRQAIAAQYRTLHGATVDPLQVLVTVGAKQALYNTFQAICDPGDEVIIAAPYWNSYLDQVRLAGAVPVIVQPTADLGIDIKALEAAITARTRAMIINTPSNPSGRVLVDTELAAIAALARRHGVFVVSDEIYELLTYAGHPHRSLVLHHGLEQQGIVIGGASKTFGVTGWRLGYALGPRELIDTMSRIQDHSTSCANSIAQRGVLAGYQGDVRQQIAGMVAEYDKRRLYTVSRLRAIPGIQVLEPHGAFYAFPRIDALYGRRYRQGAPLTGSQAFAAALLEQQKVAVVPGIAFGADQHIRLSYATSLDAIERGLDRIAAFVAELV